MNMILDDTGGSVSGRPRRCLRGWLGAVTLGVAAAAALLPAGCGGGSGSEEAAVTGSDEAVVDAVEPVVSEPAESSGSGGSGSL